MDLRSIRQSVVAAGVLLAVATSAHASSVTLSLPSNFGTAITPGLTSGVSVNFESTGFVGNVGVGAINWTVTASDDSSFKVGDAVQTFCIQGLQDVHPGGSYAYNVGNLSDAPLPVGGTDQGFLDTLAGEQIQGLVNGYSQYVGQTFMSHNANDVAAGIQLAIWEVIYDGGQGGETFGAITNYFGSNTLNNFQANGTNADGTAAIDVANYMLNHFSPSQKVDAVAFESRSDQDQFIPHAVPLPAALPAGLMLLGLLACARKVSQKLA